MIFKKARAYSNHHFIHCCIKTLYGYPLHIADNSHYELGYPWAEKALFCCFSLNNLISEPQEKAIYSLQASPQKAGTET
jgi:hypothetical protein